MRVMSVIRAAAIAAAMPIHPASATDVLCDGDFQNHGHAGASVEIPRLVVSSRPTVRQPCRFLISA